jgi:hypothetical protein
VTGKEPVRDLLKRKGHPPVIRAWRGRHHHPRAVVRAAHWVRAQVWAWMARIGRKGK